MELAELIRKRPVKATEAREIAQKLFNSKTRGEKAYKFLKDNLEGFGLKSLLTGNNNSRITARKKPWKTSGKPFSCTPRKTGFPAAV